VGYGIKRVSYSYVEIRNPKIKFSCRVLEDSWGTKNSSTNVVVKLLMPNKPVSIEAPNVEKRAGLNN